MTKRIEASLDLYGDYAPSVSVYSICGEVKLLKNILLLLNSKLINWYFLHKFSDKHLAGGYISINNLMLKQIPFKKVLEENDFALEANKFRLELQELSNKFQRTLERKFELKKLSTKLQEWYLLSYSEFIKELAKKKIKLSLSDESEWETYFFQESKKAQELKTKIETTDKAIDTMVYKLYNLTPEEIIIVEGK